MEKTETKSVGSELKAKMEQAGVTQRELSRRTGIDTSHIAPLLNGREYLGPERLSRMVKALREMGMDV